MKMFRRRESGRIGLVAVFKNERSLMAEWLAFHAAVGFDRFILYDNNSDDGSADMALAMRDRLQIDVIPWRSRGADYQVAAYDHAVGHFGRRCDWMAFLDLDEFLLPVRDDSIRTFLARVAAEYDGVALNWAVYGSSGRSEASTGLVIENYLRRAGDNAWFNNHVKMLVRPRAYVAAENPHYLRVSGPCCGGDGEPVAWRSDGFTMQPRGICDIRVNHYFTRSKADWTNKLARGYNNDLRAAGDFARYDRNELYDDAALAVAARIREHPDFATLPMPRPAPEMDPQIPSDFDAAAYLAMNPDVRAAGMDAETHFLDAGKTEGRRYRRSD